MNPKKFFIVADTKNLRIGYFYAESVFKYLKRNMKTLINMVELGKVRRNRVSQIGKLNATASDFLKLDFRNAF